MKKIFLMAIIALGFSTVSCSDDDKNTTETVIASGQLPEAARTFITTHFADATYSRVEKQAVADDDGSIYDVHLSNGFEIDFDADGNWTAIDGNTNAVPTAIIPDGIAQYIAANYASSFITSIEIEKHGYDVELSNNIDLVFNASGEFIRIDQ